MRYLVALFVLTLNVNWCMCVDKYYCDEGDVELEEVNGQYGPLCDGTLDCRGGKDEMYCDYEKARYTGTRIHLAMVLTARP